MTRPTESPVNRKAKAAFAALVFVQALHSLEEYANGFFEIFPPARMIEGMLPGFARPGFVVFNLLLVAFGVWCLVRPVFGDWPSARRWTWVWVAIELYNGIGHPVWALATRTYNPGLYSAPLLLGLAIFLALQLRVQASVSRDAAAV
jgi:hypothetical protein